MGGAGWRWGGGGAERSGQLAIDRRPAGAPARSIDTEMDTNVTRALQCLHCSKRAGKEKAAGLASWQLTTGRSAQHARDAETGSSRHGGLLLLRLQAAAFSEPGCD